jgi:hypothetical protein
MFNALKTRCLHAKNIAKTWWLLVGFVWGSFWATDALIEKYDPAGIKVAWDARTTHLPSHWQTWLVGLLVFLLLALIEGSYRHHNATTKETKDLIDDLTAKVDGLTWPADRPTLSFQMG